MQFPTVLYKCAEVLGLDIECEVQGVQGYKAHQLTGLLNLIIARDAWWKLDGDWKPDWETQSEEKFVICSVRGNILKERISYPNCILAFRTAELRDKFLETFRNLIEKCKELI